MAQYDVTLRDYWRIIRKRIIYIIFATFMLGMTSFATAYFSKPDPRYRTEAKIQYERSQSAQEAYVSALSGSDDLATQQAVLTSYELVERIAQELGYVDTTKANEEERIRAILNLRPYLNTSAESLTNIITVSVTHSNRFEAQRIANVTTEQYRQYNYEVRNALILKTRRLIQSRRDTVQVRLKHSQDQLREFQEETQIISINAATNNVLSALKVAQGTHEGLLLLRASIDKLLSNRENADEGTLLTFPPEEGGNRFAELLRSLQLLNEDRNRLLVTYTDLHPEVRKVDDRKRVIINQMLNALSVQRELLIKRQETQKNLVDELEAKFRKLPEMGIQLETLYRNVDIQARLLKAIEENFQESQLSEAEEVHEVTILQRALLPSAPINPSAPSTVAGVGAFLGLIIGIVAAFIAETLDTSIGTIEDVEEYLGVPVVGIIPQMDPESMREALEARTGSPVDMETVEKRLRLSTHFEPQSTLAESYRALRTNIQFANLEKGAKVLSITSSSHQEGKSTTTANLAVTLAQAGNRVLLVDGDLRRPTVARIFGLDREPGLTDVILGNYTWREVVRTVTDIMVGGLGMDNIMMTAGMDNLNIITSGILPPNPAEITDARRMTEFLQEVKEAYDVVLVDSPPVLQATDATVLGTKVDGVLLVYKIGNVSRSALRRAKLQLDNVGVTTLGVVINGLRADVSEDFRDLRYYSYYTYGTQSDEDTGPYLTRLYNRSIRQWSTTKNQITEQSKPILNFLKERIPILGRLLTPQASPSQEMPEPVEEESDFTTKILSVFFWIFLLMFFAAGLMWQLGYISTVGSHVMPVHTGQPSPQTTPNPPQEVPEQTQPNTPSPSDTQKETPVSPEESQEPTPTTGAQKPQMDAPLKHPSDRVQQQTASISKPQKTRAVSVAQQHRGTAQPQFAIHVSSHKIMATAKQEVQYYKKRGYHVAIVPIFITGRGQFYRVLLGQFATKQSAKQELEQLKSGNKNHYAAIVPLPNTERQIPPPKMAKVISPSPETENSPAMAVRTY